MFTPILDRVLVKRDDGEQVSKGGIILTRESIPNKGSIVATGEDVEYLKVGQNVIFGNGQGVEVDINGETYLVMEEKGVLGFYS